MELGTRQVPGHCYTCGQFGHFSKNCPNKGRLGGERQIPNPTATSGRRFKKAAYAGGGRNHSQGQGIQEDDYNDDNEEDADYIDGLGATGTPAEPVFR